MKILKIVSFSVMIISMLILVLGVNARYYAQSPEQGFVQNITNETITTPPITPPAPQTYTIIVNDFKFTPRELNITLGSNVVWRNDDLYRHSVTFNDQSFTEYIDPGKNASYTFDIAGEYPYHCSVHPSMNGEITVQ